MLIYCIYHPLFEKFQQYSQQKNIHLAAKQLLSDLKLKIKVHGSLPDRGPLLIISNHPTSLDLFTFLTVIGKRNILLLAAKINDNWGADFRRHRLPIYQRTWIFKIPWPWNWRFHLGPYQIKLLKNPVSNQKAREINRRSIRQAAASINQGQSLLIAPTGGDNGQPRNWKNGVGYLTQQINNPNSKVVFIKIKAPVQWQYRLFFPFLCHFFSQQTIHVHISKTQKLFDLINSQDNPKKITQKLKRNYFVFYQKN